MLISHELTLGQITFILRVAFQILSYGGFFFIGIIVLSTIPRVASAEAHGVVNRIVGKSSATKASIKWAFQYWRNKTGDPVTSPGFLVAVLILVFYPLFVAISDVGFIGFYACSTPYPSFFDFPASVSTDDLARAAIASNLLNGADPSSVTVHRCDAVSVERVTENLTERVCTSWHNSTYADPDVFRGLNSTDSDVLMLRYLRHPNVSQPGLDSDLNSFYISPTSQRVVDPVIVNGLVVAPHSTGLRAVLGVPHLIPQQVVTLPKTMAIEVDVGCMALGIYTQNEIASVGGFSIYATNGTWRNYTGPEYLRDLLATYVDQVREVFLPYFNVSSLNESGRMTGYNGYYDDNNWFPTNAAVRSVRIPQAGFFEPSSITAMSFVLRNCTQALKRQLNVTTLSLVSDFIHHDWCSLLLLTGFTANAGEGTLGGSGMLCASTTQVNMVLATVQMNASRSLSIDLTRLPSNLNYLYTSYRDGDKTGNVSDYAPFERFTLEDNPSGLTSHYIPSRGLILGSRNRGPGSGGNAISRLGPVMINANNVLDNNRDFAALSILDEGNRPLNFSPSFVTKWSGQIGASYLVNSLAFNGWAARAANPVTVVSTGRRAAACYRPLYAIVFIPLVITALFVLGWSLLLVTCSSFAGHNRLKESYGGLSPYVDAVCSTDEKETVLAWQNDEKPRLVFLTEERGTHVLENESATALEHFHSPRSLGRDG